MKPIQTDQQIIDTDVLIIGGGLAGCLAAIEARKRNMDVVLMEKAVMNTSGAVGIGLDHYPSIAHPMINDVTPEQYARGRTEPLEGMVSYNLSLITSENVMRPVPALESIGVKIHDRDGSFIMQGGRLRRFVDDLKYRTPDGEERIRGDYLWYKGADTKYKLAAAVRKSGVKVYERTMLASILAKDGRCVGATGINVRDGSFLTVKAKRTLLMAGGANRLHNNPVAPYPLNMFIQFATAQCCGGGIAAAYEAGAQLINMEICGAGPMGGGYARNSGMLMTIVMPYPKLVDSSGQEISKKYSLNDTQEKEKDRGLDRSGLYIEDLFERDIFLETYEGATKEQMEMMESISYRMHAIGPSYMLRLYPARGGIGGAPMEFRFGMGALTRNIAGVLHDERGESSLKGLYIAGDVGGGIAAYGASAAFTWAMICAKNASEEAAKAKAPELDSAQLKEITKTRERLLAPLGRKEGVNPLELEHLVRSNNDYYAGLKKVEPKLKRNLDLLKFIKESYVPALMARNPHELMRCIEVQSAITVSELHTKASLTRTETRMPPYHYRLDYPKQDDVNWRKSVVWQKVDGHMEYSFKVND